MERVTSSDGTSIAFTREGAGPPLLLVHGTTADRTRWQAVAPRLAEHFELIAMDRRGRGDSGDGPAYSIDRESEDVVAVIEALDGPVRVLGHSFGALCTLEAALRTERIDRMVLYEPPAPIDDSMYEPGTVERLEELVAAGRDEEALEFFFRAIVRMTDEELEVMRRPPAWERRLRMIPTIVRETMADGAYRFDATRFVGVTTPTLMLLGDQSPPFLFRATRLVRDTLPNATLAVLPGQAHVAMTTAPDLFVEAVLPFLLAQ